MQPARCADEPSIPHYCFPLIGFLLLAFGRDRWSENAAAVIGVGALVCRPPVAAIAGYDFLTHTPEKGVFVQPLWTWCPSTALRLHLTYT